MFRPHYHISPRLLDYLKSIAVLVHELNKVQVQEVQWMELWGEARAQSTHASTSIEGNPLALTAVKALFKRQPQHIQQSEQEVLNYNNALLDLQHASFSEETVLSIHQTVMQGLLVKEKVGAYRQEPVFIHNPQTGTVLFLPPDHDQVQTMMTELYAFIENHDDLDPIILAGLFHKQFVLVHPFIDGNGRTVRLASTLLLRDLGLDLFHLLSFENYYNYNISRYFAMVGEQGDFYDLNVDFTAWLEYFAEGILYELQRLEQRLSSYPQNTPQLKKHHRILLEYVAKHGSINDKEYAALVDRAKATRALDFKFLVGVGVLERKAKGPSTYYVASERKDLSS